MIDREPEFYKKLLTSLDNIAVLRKMNDDGIYVPVSCTREFARMMECTPQQFIEAETKDPLSTVHPEDHEEAAHLLMSRKARDGNNHAIIRKKTFKGHIIWVDLRYAFFNHNGEHYAYCNYFNVTRIKESELRLKAVYEEMNQQLAAIAEGSLAIARLNLSSGICEEFRGHDLYDTDRAGITIKELVDTRINNILTENDRSKFTGRFSPERLMDSYTRGAEPEPLVVLTKRQSGRLSFVKCTATLRKDPATDEIVAYLVESDYNSERVSEVLNKKILATQYDMISYVVDGRYGVVIGDAASIGRGSIFPKERQGVYIDYIKEQVIPTATEDQDKGTLLQALSPETVDARLAESEPYTVELECEIDGEKFYKRFIFYSVEREAKFYILLKVDDTKIKKEQLERNESLKSALAEANQSNVAKTAFLSNMSHEMRTPMNAIIGLGSIALKDPGLPPRTEEHLKKIGESARHLLSLINDILDMSRIESGRMALRNEEFSFKSMLEQINAMISSQCQERGLSYDCVIKGKADSFYIGDDIKLKQVLINILGNAVKFTPPPGEVLFTVERTAQYEDKSTIKFVIKDTGIGMDEEYLPKIFEAFSQEDGSSTSVFGGTGLGMAITKNIVELMNGNISVASKKGIGSEFTVNVTLRNSSHVETGTIDVNVRDFSLLVIDDDPVAIEHAQLVLKEVGISADTALSGESGIEKVKLMNARHNIYDLMLIDQRMPGMSGIETARKIRDIVGNDPAIIILTAYNWEDMMDDAKRAGVDSFMPKPLFVSSVVSEFKKVISMKNLLKRSVKEKKSDLNGVRILLAEDMLVNAEIVKELLKMRGMEVEHGENGKIVVDMFTSHPAGYYNAILMDIRMPVMDGLSATEAIRASGHPDGKKIPIIAMTANAFDEDVQRSLQAGMNAHLSKPVEPEHLYETLSELI